MSSIHKTLRAAAATALIGAAARAGGCANIHDNPQAKLSDVPLTVDQAMQKRDWAPTVALYANGSVMAPPTGFPYTVRPDLNPWLSPFAEAGQFFGQAVAWPVFMITADNPQTYSGVITPPTYTAVPPIEAVR
jgi:hypothetical protein